MASLNAGRQDDAREGVEPVGERADAGQRHAAGAHEQRREVGREPEHERQRDEEEQRRAVHGHQLGEDLARDDVAVRDRELGAHDQRERRRQHEEADAREHREDADLLVVGREQPAHDAPVLPGNDVVRHGAAANLGHHEPPFAVAALPTQSSKSLWASETTAISGVAVAPWATVERPA